MANTKNNPAQGKRQEEQKASAGNNRSNGSKNSDGPLLKKFFTDMLKDIYWAEAHLVDKLKVMMEAATTDELTDAFEDHLYATQKHKSRLEKVFRLIGEQAEAKKCEAMEGLAREAESIIGETKEGTMTRDAALIIAAQKIEHYEIATYGSLVQIARTIGYEEEADILEQTLWEEEDTDMLLTEIAESDINPMADEEDASAVEEQETTDIGEPANI